VTPAFGKRRAVTPPPPFLATIVLPYLEPTAPVSVTNDGATLAIASVRFVPANTSTQVGYLTLTLLPGATASYEHLRDAIPEATTPGSLFIQSAGTIEVRSNRADGQPLGELVPNAFRSSIIAPNSTYELGLTSTTDPVIVSLVLQDENGSPRAFAQQTLPPATSLLAPLAAVFGTSQVPAIVQVDLTVTLGTHLAAYLRDTTTGRVITAVPLTRASTRLYLPHLTAGTSVLARNAGATQTAFAQGILYTPTQKPAFWNTFLTPYSALLTPDVLSVMGLGGKTGLLIITSIDVPLLASTVKDGLWLSGFTNNDTAQGKSGSLADHTTVLDASIAGNNDTTAGPLTVGVANVSYNVNNQAPLPLTGTLTATTNAGVVLGSRTISLAQSEGVEYTGWLRSLAGSDVVGVRVVLHVDNDPHQGMNIVPQAVLYTRSSAGTHVGVRIPAIVHVSGEQYVAKWLDPLSQSYFYWNNNETAALLVSTGSARDYGAELLRLLYPQAGSPGTEAEFIAHFKGLADGNVQNGELYAFDPGYFDFRSGRGLVCFALASQGNFSCLHLADAGIAQARAITRSFMVERTGQHPDAYGGNIVTGPSLSFNPTWSTQDLTSTTVTAEQYVATWLDPLQQQYFFVDNVMSRCLWQGNCGTTDYATAVAVLLAQSATTPERDPARLLQAFRDVTDGNPANDELYGGFSPINIDLRGSGNVRIYLAPKGTSIVDWVLSPALKAQVYDVFRAFAVAYFGANPAACGGAPLSDCRVDFDPGFTNQLKGQVTMVTGEEYVAQWLDPLSRQYFYLSNSEVHDLLNGTTGIPSFAPQLAAVLGPATGNSASAMESILRAWVDGSTVNGEVYAGFDPLNIDLRSPGGIRFYMAPDGTGASDFDIDSTALQQTYAIIRAFLVQRTQTYPSQYGGTAAAGPSLTFNPTWSTQNLS